MNQNNNEYWIEDPEMCDSDSCTKLATRFDEFGQFCEYCWERNPYRKIRILEEKISILESELECRRSLYGK